MEITEKPSPLEEKLAKLGILEQTNRKTGMVNDYKLLNTKPLAPNTSFHHPEWQDSIVHMDTSAMSVFTDFKGRPPVTTHPDTLTTDAMNEMKLAHVKALVVTNDEEDILGLVSIKDIQGIKTGLAAQEKNIPPSEVTVSMVMTPTEKLETIDFKDLSNARVGHIARILHEHDLQHLLVVDYDEINTPKVRGIFSGTRISRQLGEDIMGTLSSQSVGEMNKRI